MAVGTVFNLDDPSLCEAVFPSKYVELFPTAKGNFHAEITQVGMKGVWLHLNIQISLPEITTVAVKPGRRSIGFFIEGNSSSLLNCGLEVRGGDIVLNRSDVIHQRSGANFHYGTASLPSDDLAAAAEDIIGRELPEKPYKSTIRPPSEYACYWCSAVPPQRAATPPHHTGH